MKKVSKGKKKLKGEYILMTDFMNLEISDFAEMKRKYMANPNSLIKLRKNSKDIIVLDKVQYLLKIIPENIKFRWKGKYFDGEKWQEEEWLFTEIKTDNRLGKTTARAYISHRSYFGPIDSNSGMPAYTNTNEYNKFLYEAREPKEAIIALYDWLVKNKFINKDGSSTKIMHLQDDNSLKYEKTQ